LKAGGARQGSQSRFAPLLHSTPPLSHNALEGLYKGVRQQRSEK
jgi:hypothetical protein